MAKTESRVVTGTNARNRVTFQPKVQLVQIRRNPPYGSLILAARGVADGLVVAALVAEEGQGEQAATQHYREEDPKDRRDHEVEIKLSGCGEIGDCPGRHDYADHGDPPGHPPEFRFGLFPLIQHGAHMGTPHRQFQQRLLIDQAERSAAVIIEASATIFRIASSNTAGGWPPEIR